MKSLFISTSHKSQQLKSATHLVQAMLLAVLVMFSGCVSQAQSGSAKQFPESPFRGGKAADLTGYYALSDFTGTSHLVKTNVLEVEELIKQKKTFILYTGYESCPHCNHFLPILNEVAEEFNTTIGYIDTRENPSWESNLDIDDYDTFVEYFGEWLDDDEQGRRHLYVPETFFVKDGVVLAAHMGVPNGTANSKGDLTEAEQQTARRELAGMFEQLM